MVLYNRELLVSFPYLRLEDGAWERDYIKYPDWTSYYFQIHCELYIQLYMYIHHVYGSRHYKSCWSREEHTIAIAASHYDT